MKSNVVINRWRKKQILLKKFNLYQYEKNKIMLFHFLKSADHDTCLNVCHVSLTKTKLHLNFGV